MAESKNRLYTPANEPKKHQGNRRKHKNACIRKTHVPRQIIFKENKYPDKENENKQTKLNENNFERLCPTRDRNEYNIIYEKNKYLNTSLPDFKIKFNI